MNPWTTLVRREFWENRALWIAPLVTAGFLIVGCIFAAAKADRFSPGPRAERKAIQRPRRVGHRRPPCPARSTAFAHEFVATAAW